MVLQRGWGLGLFLLLGQAQAQPAVPTFRPELRPDLQAAQLSCPQWQAVSVPHLSELASHQRLLYLWSPRMVLSVLHAHEVKQVAQDLGLQWQAASDPRVPAPELATAWAAMPAGVQTALAGSQPLCDAVLLAQGQSLRHLPTAWVLRWDAAGQRWQPQGLPIVSAMPPVFWRQAVHERLQGTNAAH